MTATPRRFFARTQNTCRIESARRLLTRFVGIDEIKRGRIE
jgi:hypothetical protein